VVRRRVLLLDNPIPDLEAWSEFEFHVHNTVEFEIQFSSPTVIEKLVDEAECMSSIVTRCP
jgi:hypothetical protein